MGLNNVSARLSSADNNSVVLMGYALPKIHVAISMLVRGTNAKQAWKESYDCETVLVSDHSGPLLSDTNIRSLGGGLCAQFFRSSCFLQSG